MLAAEPTFGSERTSALVMHDFGDDYGKTLVSV